MVKMAKHLLLRETYRLLGLGIDFDFYDLNSIDEFLGIVVSEADMSVSNKEQILKAGYHLKGKYNNCNKFLYIISVEELERINKC